MSQVIGKLRDGSLKHMEIPGMPNSHGIKLPPTWNRQWPRVRRP